MWHEFERKLIEALQEENIFRQMATVIKTSSGDRKIPIVTAKGEAVWMDEEEQYTSMRTVTMPIITS